MRIAGFSIVRQGHRFGYPFVASLRSLLPLVDELVLGVGDGDDGTWETLKALKEPKLKLFRSVWDMREREGGKVLSVETNKALARCKGDWAVYLQADELLHEDDLPLIRQSMQKNLGLPVGGLSFRYLHFYGSYQTLQDQPRKWYRRAVRAVRLGRGIESVGDAYGFKGPRGASLTRRDGGARIFHYGWSRPPGIMAQKQRNLDSMYHDEAWLERHHPEEAKARADFYGDRGHLKFFHGSHPAPIRALAASQDWSFDHQIGRQWPAWLRHLYVTFVYPVRKRLGWRFAS
ncbi:MAG: glycosyltransferase [candidate division FCPU426 bacterium]